MTVAELVFRSFAQQWSGTHIYFIPTGVRKGQKTMRWNVTDKSSGLLGEVKWFGRWRKYSFFPATMCVFEQTCLREIAQFCEDRTTEQRNGI